MYDIKPLEKQWKTYYLKKRVPYLIFILVLTIFILFYFIFYNKMDFENLYNKIVLNNTLNTNYKMNTNKDILNKILLNNKLIQLEKNNMIRREVFLKRNLSQDSLVDIPILDNTEDSKKILNNKKKIHLDIIQTSSITAYEDVEKRFLQTHDIDDALFLAKSYYKKGNYEKARYWALKINNINENIEDSILIFVESKIKLGQKNEALLILKNYIKKSNSENAKKLLNKIENNKL